MSLGRRLVGATSSGWAAVQKVLRFVCTYGPARTFYKTTGRLRLTVPFVVRQRRLQDIGVIGCGQFAYATLGHFLQQTFGGRIAACYDVDEAAAQTFARAFRVPKLCGSVEALVATEGLRIVYVVSNHASHADLAAQALGRNLDVYVEKPIAVNDEQLVRLLRARRNSKARLFAGYNRPFAAATRLMRALTPIDAQSGITLHCFINGHKLAPDHWYRRPEEGTRICGNAGHWLDLMVHILNWRGLPDKLDVSVTWADQSEPDDNLQIGIRSDRGDLFGVTMSSRTEPFEGVSETLNFQHGATICKIDDFRSLTLWRGSRKFRRRFWPKDVGHRFAILQPFQNAVARDWQEVELSTMLTLHISNMVRTLTEFSTFSFREARTYLDRAVASQ